MMRSRTFMSMSATSTATTLRPSSRTGAAILIWGSRVTGERSTPATTEPLHRSAKRLERGCELRAALDGVGADASASEETPRSEVGSTYVLMMRWPARRFLTLPLPPGFFAARFLAAVILPPLLFFAI